MARVSTSRTVRPTTARNGFTLLEMLLTVMLMAAMSVLVLNVFREPDNEHLFFMNRYLEKQCEALVNRKAIHMEESPVAFYPSGRVDQARTVSFKDHSVIVHLGNGYLTYE